MNALLQQPIYTETGETTSLDTVLPHQPTVVVFLRQGECIECTMMIDELQKLYSHVISWKIPLIFIANGAVTSMPRLRERLQLSASIPLFTDPSLAIYREAGLYYDWKRSVGPTAVWTIAKGLMSGFSQTRLGDHLPQQSGVVIFNSERTLEWIHKSEHIGDIPSSGSILEILLRLKNTNNKEKQ